jgi:hypothetical protein
MGHTCRDVGFGSIAMSPTDLVRPGSTRSFQGEVSLFLIEAVHGWLTVRPKGVGFFQGKPRDRRALVVLAQPAISSQLIDSLYF